MKDSAGPYLNAWRWKLCNLSKLCNRMGSTSDDAVRLTK